MTSSWHQLKINKNKNKNIKHRLKNKQIETLLVQEKIILCKTYSQDFFLLKSIFTIHKYNIQ